MRLVAPLRLRQECHTVHTASTKEASEPTTTPTKTTESTTNEDLVPDWKQLSTPFYNSPYNSTGRATISSATPYNAYSPYFYGYSATSPSTISLLYNP